MERVFLKLEKIRDVTGNSLKEDVYEIHLILQVNRDLDDMHNGIVLNYVEEQENTKGG